jgi:hypothetical protein
MISRLSLHFGQMKAFSEAFFVISAFTLITKNKMSSPRALVADFAVIISTAAPKFKERSKSLVSGTHPRDDVLANQRVDIPMEAIRHQREPQFR